MFERARIGGVLYNVCDALARDGSRVDKVAIRDLTDEFMDLAVKDMRKLGLAADQAAAALIINLTNTFHKGDLLQKLRADEYEHFNSLRQMYFAFEQMIRSQPEHFKRAHVLLDDDVTEMLLAE